MQFLTIGWKKKEKEKKLNTLVAISDQKGLKKNIAINRKYTNKILVWIVWKLR